MKDKLRVARVCPLPVACAVAMAVALALGPAPAAGASKPALPATSGGYYEDALRYHRGGDYRAAIIQLRNALKENPEHLPSRILLGRSYLATGNPKAAERELRIALQKGADENLVLVPMGLALGALARHEELLTVIEPQGRNGRVDARLMLIRADSLLSLKRLDEAEDAYVDAARLDPGGAAPRVGRARVEIARGRFEAAEALLDAALELDPDSANAWHERGQLRRQFGELDAALGHFQRAIELEPGHLRAHNARAGVFIDLGEYDKADADIRFVRRANPADVESIYLAALLHVRRGDPDGARRVLELADERLLSVVTTDTIRAHPQLQLLSGLVDYALGNPETAAESLRSFLDRVPNHPGAVNVLAAILLERGQFQEAIRYLEPIAFGRQHDAVAFTLLGNAYRAAKRYDDAKRVYERAAGLTERPGPALTALAETKLLSGQTADAVRDLETVLAADPRALGAGRLLIRLQLAARRFERALALLTDLRAEYPERLDLLELEAAVHVGLEQFDAARAAYERVLVVDPDHRSAPINLAKLEAARGDVDGAVRQLEALLESRPEEPVVMGELARIAISQGRLDDAVVWLEKAGAADLDAVDQRVALVDLYLQLGRSIDAERVVRELEERAPEDPRVLMTLGRVRAAGGNMSNARLAFRRMAKFAGYDVTWLHRAAQEQVRIGDFDGAAWSLEKALNGDSNHLPSEIAQVALMSRRGRHEPARVAADALVAKYPEVAAVHRARGEAAFQAGEFARAVDAFSRAFELRGDPEVAIRLFASHRESGDLPSAIAFLERWLERAPDDALAARTLGSAYIEAGRLDAALATLERLESRLPDDADVLNNLAWLRGRRGEEAALDLARRAHDLAPEAPSVLDTYGWLLVQRDRLDEGLALLRQAHSRASEDAEIRYHLGVALMRLGRTDEGRAELRGALERDPAFEGAADARALLAAP